MRSRMAGVSMWYAWCHLCLRVCNYVLVLKLYGGNALGVCILLCVFFAVENQYAVKTSDLHTYFRSMPQEELNALDQHVSQPASIFRAAPQSLSTGFFQRFSCKVMNDKFKSVNCIGNTGHNNINITSNMHTNLQSEPSDIFILCTRVLLLDAYLMNIIDSLGHFIPDKQVMIIQKSCKR